MLRRSPALAGILDLPPPVVDQTKLNRNPKGLRAEWETLLDRVAGGEMPYSVAQSMGFHRSALSNYLRTDPNMVADLLAAEAVAAEQVESALYRRALDGDTRAASLWLTNRAAARWRDARRVEVTGSVQHEIEVGPTLERIADLQNRLLARKQLALESGDVIEAEVVEQ